MKMAKKTMMFVFAIAVSSASVCAQQPRSIQWSGPVTFEGPAQDVPAGLTKIFSNLGPPTSAFGAGGWFVVGPASTQPTQFVAMRFTSDAAAHVSQVRAAIQYESGVNQVNLSLYSDVDGIPGTL
jgi:hypothetical protein